MMTAGLRIKNDSGDVQIDQDYRNMHLAGYRQLDRSAEAQYLGTYVNPVCVIHSDVLFAFGALFRKEFSNPSRWWFNFFPAVGQTVQVFVFDVGITLNPNFGLRIFNASGQVCFHSGAKPLVVVDQIVASKNATTTRTYVSGRKYAILPVAIQTGYRFRSIANGVEIVADNASQTRPTGIFLVVDVTSY